MEQDDAGMSPLLLWGIVLAATLAGLAFVLLFILPNCASLPVRGEVSGECGTIQMGVIGLSSAMFLAGALFAGYRIAVAVREERETAGRGR